MVYGTATVSPLGSMRTSVESGLLAIARVWFSDTVNERSEFKSRGGVGGKTRGMVSSR